jgi:hypothetical protein
VNTKVGRTALATLEMKRTTSLINVPPSRVRHASSILNMRFSRLIVLVVEIILRESLDPTLIERSLSTRISLSISHSTIK